MSLAHRKRVQEGKNNFYKNSQSYAAVHLWLHQYYGLATKCENKDCEKKKANYFEWANISKEYKRDRNDFIQLCASCHRKWDMGVIEINL